MPLAKKSKTNGVPEDCSSSFGVIDLFSGVGGFSLGAARAGFILLAAVDNDPRAAASFASNFPKCVQIQENIAQTTWPQLRKIARIGERTVHGVIGGPPCQGFSVLGRRAPNDDRNNLFDHFFRLVAEIRPWFYVAENVPGILDPSFKSITTKARERLRGYRHLPPLVLKSSDFGAPTTRARVFFIGYRHKFLVDMAAIDFHAPEQIEQITVEMALYGLPCRIDPNWQSMSEGWRKLSARQQGKFWDNIFNNIPPSVGNPNALERLGKENVVSGCLGTKHTRAVLKRFAVLKEGSVDGPSRTTRLQREGLCPTLRAGTGPEHGSFQALRPIHPTEPRVITPREAARLQGFPDWYQFDATKWHSFRQIGNSVSPILAENIMRIVAAHVRREEDRDDD